MFPTYLITPVCNHGHASRVHDLAVWRRFDIPDPTTTGTARVRGGLCASTGRSDAWLKPKSGRDQPVRELWVILHR